MARKRRVTHHDVRAYAIAAVFFGFSSGICFSQMHEEDPNFPVYLLALLVLLGCCVAMVIATAGLVKRHFKPIETDSELPLQ